MKLAPRTIYRIQWHAANKRWICTVENRVVDVAAFNKGGLVRATAHVAKTCHRAGYLGQVVVHGKNGKIQTEWTYGADPKRSKG